MIPSVNKRPSLHIIARLLTSSSHSRQAFADLPLRHNTLCIVLDPRTDKSRFELLCECQEKSKSGSVIYEDFDWGKGVHPEADKIWMEKLIRKGQWSSKIYNTHDVISRAVGERDYTTVFLRVIDKEKETLLNKIRRKSGYWSDELVRVSFTNFLKAGGDEREALEILEGTSGGDEVVNRRKQRKELSRTRARARAALRRLRPSNVCEHYDVGTSERSADKKREMPQKLVHGVKYIT
jgi:hypothetical protein